MQCLLDKNPCSGYCNLYNLMFVAYNFMICEYFKYKIHPHLSDISGSTPELVKNDVLGTLVQAMVVPPKHEPVVIQLGQDSDDSR